MRRMLTKAFGSFWFWRVGRRRSTSCSNLVRLLIFSSELDLKAKNLYHRNPDNLSRLGKNPKNANSRAFFFLNFRSKNTINCTSMYPTCTSRILCFRNFNELMPGMKCL